MLGWIKMRVPWKRGSQAEERASPPMRIVGAASYVLIDKIRHMTDCSNARPRHPKSESCGRL